MKILVVIPTHDRDQFIGEALESLREQTRKPDTVMVTGNVIPTDEANLIDCVIGTGQVVLLRNELPFDVRLNQAVADVQCDAYLLLSDDDKLDSRYIEKTASAMERGQADVVTTGVRWFGEDGEPAASLMQRAMGRRVFQVPGMPHISSLVTKHAWELAGGYKGVSYFDQEFWREVKAAGCDRWVWVQEPLFWYRIHEGQVSAKFDGKELQ